MLDGKKGWNSLGSAEFGRAQSVDHHLVGGIGDTGTKHDQVYRRFTCNLPGKRFESQLKFGGVS